MACLKKIYYNSLKIIRLGPETSTQESLQIFEWKKGTKLMKKNIKIYWTKVNNFKKLMKEWQLQNKQNGCHILLHINYI